MTTIAVYLPGQLNLALDFFINCTVLFLIDISTVNWYYLGMKRKYQKILELIFHHPVSGNIKWNDIESLFIELGAEISEREGSRIGVRLFNTRKVFHRPHPSPNTDKGAVASIREWLRENKVVPK